MPLYVVIGSGVLATAVATLRGQTRLRRLPKPLVLALVLVICLYALQTIYSEDVAFAARNVGFFLIPFAILFSLLAEATWDRRLLKLALAVLLAEGVILALIGIGQFADQHIFWNGKLEASNDFHFYFRVNSLFWDPNIYGRYLVLSILLGATALLWVVKRSMAFLLTGAVAVVFVGLVFAFSQTSFIALFVGLAVLAGLRWSVRWAILATPVALVAIAVGVLFLAGGSNESARTVTEGHSSLVSGGLKLAKQRPLYGYGSASFSKAFGKEENVPAGDNDDLAHRAGHGRRGAGRDRPARISGAAGRSTLDRLLRHALDRAGSRSALQAARGRGSDRAHPSEDRDRRSLQRAARPHDRLRGVPHRSAHLGPAGGWWRACGRGRSGRMARRQADPAPPRPRVSLPSSS